MNSFKVAIVGEYGVGKSSYLEKLSMGRFKTRGKRSEGSENATVTFSSSEKRITFNTSIVPGRYVSINDRSAFYSSVVSVDAVIIIFDVSKRNSKVRAEKLREEILIYNKDVPIVLCGNKADLLIAPDDSNCLISVETGLNLEKPFVELLKKLGSDLELTLTK
jgi:GTP-binding nuclear protein Ran